MLTDADHDLLTAAAEGNADGVRAAVKAGADVNASDPRESTALHLAIQASTHLRVDPAMSHAIVRELIQNGANVNARNAREDTALHLAVTHQHHDILKELLANGADHYHMNRLGEAPLHLAITQGHEKAVMVLLNHGASVHLPDVHGRTPLHLAVLRKSDRMDLLKTLVNRGANPSEPDNRGRSAVDYAVAQDREDIAAYLKDVLAQQEKERTSPDTMLFQAARNGNAAGVRSALDTGADVNARLKDGKSPLHVAVLGASGEEIIRELIARGADLRASDIDNKRPLDYARDNGRANLTEILQEKPTSFAARLAGPATSHVTRIAESKGRSGVPDL